MALKCKGRKKLTPQENIKRMGDMPMFKLLLIQSIPNIFSLLSLSLYQIIISIYIGNFLDQAALAAQSIYSPIEYLICTSLPTAFSSGAVTLIGPALGQGKKDLANNYLMQFLYWSLFFCVICPAALLPGLKYIVKVLGATTQAEFDQAYPYSFLITLLGPLFYTPNGGFLPLFRCENRSGTAMIVQVTSSILCVVFGSIIFPTIGKKLGLASAALCTLLSLFPTSIYTVLNFIGCFNMGCCIRRCKVTQRSVLQFIPRVKPKFRIIGTIVAQAMPQFLNAIPYHVGVWLCNLQIGKYVSDTARRENLSAAMGMTNKLGFVVLQPRMAIYMAFASILAYNFGAKKYDRVLKLCKYCFWYIIGVISGLSLLMIALCNPLSKMFSRDPEFVKLGQKALILSMVGYPLGGPLMLCSGIYQIFKKPWLASIFQLIRLVLTIVFMFAVPPMFGIDYIFVAFSIADTLTGFVGLGFFIYLYRKIKKMQDQYLKEQEAVKEAEATAKETIEAAREDALHGDIE